jgi:hypothetical protein
MSMNRFTKSMCGCWLVAFLGLIPGSLRADTRAGFAERDITPDIGMEQPGGYHKSFHQKLHDPCKVRVALFDDGPQRVVIVGVDTLVLPRQFVLNCRKRIEEKCGIPGQCVMIAASHSHSSGPMGMVQPGEFDHASPLVQKLAYQESSAANPVYLQKVENALVEAVAAANESRIDVECGFGYGIEDQVAFNRRFRMRNGESHTHPGAGNPDIVGVAGPTDPQVGVVGVWNKQGKLAGCVVNFACHATTSPGGISANYIYYLERVVRGAMGQDAIVVFTAGACGDLTQVDNMTPYENRGPEAFAEFVGGRVGAEAVKVLLTMDRGSKFTVASRSKTLRIDRRKPNPERVKAALQMIEHPDPKTDPSELTWAKETLLLDAKIAKEPTADVEVQAIQIGAAVFVANPAEYFCQYGLDIKKGSPFPVTCPVELANGCVGYVPTEDALGKGGGGYETRLTSYSNLIPTAGTTIANECIALTRELKPEPLPTRPPHAPFSGKGWNYGNVPPQVE